MLYQLEPEDKLLASSLNRAQLPVYKVPTVQLDISAPENGVTLFESLAENNAGYLKGCKKHYDELVKQPRPPTAPSKPTEPRKPYRSSNVSKELMNRYNERYETKLQA